MSASAPGRRPTCRGSAPRRPTPSDRWGRALVTNVDYNKLKLIGRHNGKVVQETDTTLLIFSINNIVSYTSRYIALEPGDVIFTGTPGVTQAMKPGDTFEWNSPVSPRCGTRSLRHWGGTANGAPDPRADFAALGVGAKKAPGNESITQADLRADLFFLAGDAMRGRLTDTNENRATADYIRAALRARRLEAGDGQFACSTNTTDERDAWRGQHPLGARRGRAASRPVARAEAGAGVLSATLQRTRDARPARSCSPATASSPPKWNHDDYKKRRNLRGRIVMVLDHEPGERDPKSAFEGVVTAEPAAAVAQGARRPGEGRSGHPFRQ